MVTTTHNCEVCHKQFPKNQLKEAEKHEAIPIREGDFDNVVLKCKEERPHYFLYRKTEKVDEAHERIYRRCLLCSWLEIKYPIVKSELDIEKWEEYPVSQLEGVVRDKRRLPLSPEEMDMLKSFVGNIHHRPDYLRVENLRTL